MFQGKLLKWSTLGKISGLLRLLGSMKWSCTFHGWGLSAPGPCCENAIAPCLPEALLCTGGCCIAPSRTSPSLSVTTPGDLLAILISQPVSTISLQRECTKTQADRHEKGFTQVRSYTFPKVHRWRWDMVLDEPPGSWAIPAAQTSSLFKVKKAQVWSVQQALGRVTPVQAGQVLRMSGQDALKIYHLLQNKGSLWLLLFRALHFRWLI